MHSIGFHFNNLIKFEITFFNEIKKLFYITALYLAVQRGNIEIIKLLLSNDKIDPNIICILQSNYIKF